MAMTISPPPRAALSGRLGRARRRARRAAAPALSTAPAQLSANGYLAVLADGKVSLALPKTEMGQGILTALTMLVAEELGLAPTAIDVSIPEADRARFAPVDDHGRLDLDPRAVEAAAPGGCQCAHGAGRCGGAALESHPDGLTLADGAVTNPARASAWPLPRWSPMPPARAPMPCRCRPRPGK
jgi:isoquinoline 1-oxidoreductase beta subunit